MIARLSRIVLMVRKGESLIKATEFYHSALGLSLLRVTDDWAELSSDTVTISLQGVTSEAQVSTGYSPLLNFEIDDMDDTIVKCMQMGGHLDGPIQYPAHGKIAAVRSPDGHMIGLYEPAIETTSVKK
jgi:predicted enzyme related to lactoylglutathione lyase